VKESDAGPALNGFVLMLDNITRDFADESERDRLLHALTEGTRASLGNLQAAVELLDDPGLDAPTRERFLGVVRDEVQAMSRRTQEVATHTAQAMKTRWPLEDMQGADLLAAACRRIEAEQRCRASAAPVDADLWLKVDSFSVLQALGYLSGRLVDDYGIRHVELRLATQGPHARLDLVWFGQAMSTETTMGWETDPIRVGADSVALTVRDVVERHDGAFWFERERVRHACLFAMLLPRADAAAPLETDAVLRSESRPEVYDFDLFRASDASRALADRRLVELVFTVFDTETTGLDPSGGDRILQIGATRIVAGKLRREDCFEQLVDPQRDIPAAGIPIHGITPEMVKGAPAQDVVLPAFHAYAADTVLVAHNAAFDMRFLELAEARTGVRFDQPVLDTLLLSAVAHPAATPHSATRWSPPRSSSNSYPRWPSAASPRSAKHSRPRARRISRGSRTRVRATRLSRRRHLAARRSKVWRAAGAGRSDGRSHPAVSHAVPARAAPARRGARRCPHRPLRRARDDREQLVRPAVAHPHAAAVREPAVRRRRCAHHTQAGRLRPAAVRRATGLVDQGDVGQRARHRRPPGDAQPRQQLRVGRRLSHADAS
jgi:hypothetical protein